MKNLHALPISIEQLYDSLQKEHPKELEQQMRTFHLTPEMMKDPTLTAEKYIKYLADNDIKLPAEEMSQIINLAKLEDSYKANQLQKATQWTNHVNITSTRKGKDPKWETRLPPILASLDSDVENKIYKNFSASFKDYKMAREKWADAKNIALEQMKIIASELNVEIDPIKVLEKENTLLSTLGRQAGKEIPEHLAREILEAIVRNSRNHSKAIKEITKHNSDEIIQSVAGKAARNIDDVASTIKDAFKSTSDDIARSVAGSVGDDAAQAGAQWGLAVLGPLATAGGFAYDQSLLNKYKENVKKAMMSIGRLDLAIAADYLENLETNNNTSPTNSQHRALNNISDIMVKNGQVRVITQQVIRDIGTAGGAIGGPGAGLTVLALMKDMNNDDEIPSIESIQSYQKELNTLGSSISATLAFLFPPALLFTVPGQIAGNIAYNVLKNHVREWEAKKSYPDNKSFLKEIGEIALEFKKNNPKAFEPMNLKKYQLHLAEGAASRLAKGSGNYSVNDILILQQFIYQIDNWFPDNNSNNLIERYVTSNAKELANCISKSGIEKYEIGANKTLMKAARTTEKNMVSVS